MPKLPFNPQVPVAGTAVTFNVRMFSQSTTAGAFILSVTALDANGLFATGYVGSVAFASTDKHASTVLPANTTALVAGRGTFSATLFATGGQKITVTDTVTSSITATSGGVQVTGYGAAYFATETAEVLLFGEAKDGTVSWVDRASVSYTPITQGPNVHVVRDPTFMYHPQLPHRYAVFHTWGASAILYVCSGFDVATSDDGKSWGTASGSNKELTVGTIAGALANTHTWAPSPFIDPKGPRIGANLNLYDPVGNNLANSAFHVFFACNPTATANNDFTLFKIYETHPITDITWATWSTPKLLALPALIGTINSNYIDPWCIFDVATNAYYMFARQTTVLSSPADATKDRVCIYKCNSFTGTADTWVWTAFRESAWVLGAGSSDLLGTNSHESPAMIMTRDGTKWRFYCDRNPPGGANAGTWYSEQAVDVNADWRGNNSNVWSALQRIAGIGSTPRAVKPWLVWGSTDPQNVALGTGGTSGGGGGAGGGGAGNLSGFILSSPTTATGGAGFLFTATALDLNGSPLVNFAASLPVFFSSDGAATIPAVGDVVGGTSDSPTYSITLTTSGNQQFGVASTLDSSIMAFVNVAVDFGTMDHFLVSGPATATTGTAWVYTVTARDSANNTVTNYGGAPVFTSTDSFATLASAQSLTSGVGIFSATLIANGTTTLTATDASVSSVTGTSAPVVSGVMMAVANRTSNSAAVLFNTGSGLTTMPIFYAVGTTPTAVALADINADGKIDMVVVNQASSTVSVLLANGDGTFQTQVTYAIGADCQHVAIADVNGDGKNDLVVPSQTANNIGILLGNGDGTFQVMTTVAATAPWNTVPVDLNADSKLDLIVAGVGNNVGVMMGNGNGTFQALTTYAVGAVGQGTIWCAVADLNADSKVDIAAVVYPDNVIAVLLGNGNGTFQAPTTYTGVSGQQTIAIADMTGDGKPDLIFTTTAGVGVMLGNGDGTFQALTTYATGVGSNGIVAADLNGDTIKDIITSNETGNTVSVLLSNGNGTFQATADFTTGTFPIQVAFAYEYWSVRSTLAGFAVTFGAVTAGTQFLATVTALTPYNATYTGYSGTVHFTSNDTQGVLPDDSTLTSGVGVFSVTLKTSASRTITAADTVNTLLKGQKAVTVTAAVAHHWNFGMATGFNPATAGVKMTFTMTARDAFNNTATSFTGQSVHVGSTDTAASDPPNKTVTSGSAGVMSYTLQTAASTQTLTAADVLVGTLTGSSQSITVS